MYFQSVIRSRIVLSLASILFGIILIAKQRSAVDSIIVILGIILLINAAAFFLMYVFGKNRFSSQLISAFFLGIFGLFFVIRPDLIVNLFPVVMGIILILSGLFDLKYAVELPGGTGGKIWMVLFSILVIVSGVVALLHPGTVADVLILYAGVCMVVNGVFSLIVMLINRKGQQY